MMWAKMFEKKKPSIGLSFKMFKTPWVIVYIINGFPVWIIIEPIFKRIFFGRCPAIPLNKIHSINYSIFLWFNYFNLIQRSGLPNMYFEEFSDGAICREIFKSVLKNEPALHRLNWVEEYIYSCCRGDIYIRW